MRVEVTASPTSCESVVAHGVENNRPQTTTKCPSLLLSENAPRFRYMTLMVNSLFGSLLGVNSALLAHSSKDNNVCRMISSYPASFLAISTHWCPCHRR